MRRKTCHLCEERDRDRSTVSSYTAARHGLQHRQMCCQEEVFCTCGAVQAFGEQATWGHGVGVCAPGVRQQRLQVIQDKMAARAELMSIHIASQPAEPCPAERWRSRRPCSMVMTTRASSLHSITKVG